MTKKLTLDETREILWNGGKVDAYIGHSSTPDETLYFDKDEMLLLTTGGLQVGLYEYDYFTEHKELKTFEYWINIYPTHTSEGQPTREAADICASSRRIACIKVTGKEGDGL